MQNKWQCTNTCWQGKQQGDKKNHAKENCLSIMPEKQCKKRKQKWHNTDITDEFSVVPNSPIIHRCWITEKIRRHKLNQVLPGNKPSCLVPFIKLINISSTLLNKLQERQPLHNSQQQKTEKNETEKQENPF